MIKLVFKTILFISIFFVLGLVISFLGLKYPANFQSYSTLSWALIFICFIISGVIFEFTFEKLNQKYSLRFWEKFSERDIRKVNKLIVIILFLVVTISIIIGLLN